MSTLSFASCAGMLTVVSRRGRALAHSPLVHRPCHTPLYMRACTRARRQLELMRQQVMLTTSARFQAARAQLASMGGSTVDRSVRSLLFEEGRVGVHPMMRNVAAGVGARPHGVQGAPSAKRCSHGGERTWGYEGYSSSAACSLLYGACSLWCAACKPLMRLVAAGCEWDPCAGGDLARAQVRA